MQRLTRSRKIFEAISSLLLTMFVMFGFLLMFSYTQSFTNVKNNFYQNGIFSDAFNNDEFLVQTYTWKCQNQKCVKHPAENDEVSLTTCNMLCSQPPIWPQPANIIVSKKQTSIINKRDILFNLYAQGLVKTMLQNATDLFIKNLESLKPGNQSTPGIKLNIDIILFDSNTDKLGLNTNESYQLTIKKQTYLKVVIKADNFFGARHGLETLNQLIWYDEVTDELKILHDVDINDFPKFPYRGLMIDTARNFFSMSLIKKVVDGMAMTKLNTLHLHLTDAVSFPIALPRTPQLSFFGAYGSDMIYTPKDIRELVQYSRIRGIRLLLEVDAPGHVNAGWNFFDNKYVICGEDDVFNGHLNPDNNDVLEALKDIYSDLLDLSDNNELFHIGADEVNVTCWKETDAAKNANVSMLTFWAQYTNQMLESLKESNNDTFPDHVIMWSSPLTESPQLEKLNINVTVQVWLGDPRRILAKGHKVIYSTVGHWYLDCGFGPWKPSMKSGVCDPYTSWQTFYNYRPWIEYSYQELVLGGEVCLWSEQVEVDTLETRIWPRTAAFAERIWSDPSSTNSHDIYTRLVSFREKLKIREIASAAMWPRWCSQNPGKC